MRAHKPRGGCVVVVVVVVVVGEGDVGGETGMVEVLLGFVEKVSCLSELVFAFSVF